MKLTIKAMLNTDRTRVYFIYWDGLMMGDIDEIEISEFIEEFYKTQNMMDKIVINLPKVDTHEPTEE